MRQFEKYCTTGFNSYEDFKENFKVTVPENFNFVYDVVDVLASEKPDKRALLWTNQKGRARTFTFKDIAELSKRAANMFTAEGIKKGDKVMVILKRHCEFWIVLMALHRIGATAIPATHLLTKKDIVYRNNAADVKMIIATSDDNLKEQVELAEGESPTLQVKMLVGRRRKGWLNFRDEMEKYGTDFPRPTGDAATANEDIMLLYFTSGTTGMPKMVAHDFTYPLGHIVTAVYWHNVDPDGAHLTIADTGWAKSAWGKLYGQWLGETCIFVYDMDKFVPADVLQKICDYKVTTFCAPPTMYRYFIKEDLTKYDLSNLKYATIAGEPLNPEVYHQFYNATGLKLKEIYGQTEMVVTIGNFLWMEPRPGSMGKPNPCYDIDLVSDSGEPCATGETGEIVVRTGGGVPVGMFKGYYRDEERTKNTWYDDMYHTGDVAWRDEDGYYWYVGRTDDIIKSSGYRIGPFEVESALMEHPAVLETAITGVPHPERGQIVKATIVLAKGYAPSEELKRALQEHVKKTTAPYKYPREIEFVEEMPKTISGKIRRVELREQDAKKSRK
ncbi:MAG TPA: acetyl-CoA synthetase [Clostridiales bacterium]|nr:acetyl-CoA synthetase [Clostridiales bacterium]